MLRASLRGLLSRKLRLVLAIVAIVLGVGFQSGAFVLRDSLGARFERLFESINENVSVQVLATEAAAEQDPPPLLTDADLARLRALPGAEAAAGDVTVNGVIPFRTTDGKSIPSQTGVNLGGGVTGGDDFFSIVELAEGAWPDRAGEVVVSRLTQEQSKVSVGGTLKVYLPEVNESRDFTVTGVAVYSAGRSSLAGEHLVLFQMAEAQTLFYGRTGVYGTAYLAARPGVSQEQLREQAAAALPAGFEAKTGEQVTEDNASGVAESLSVVTYFLLAFAGVAVLVGIFLIFNTFNIIVAQRTRELALFRAMGASWAQVTGAVLVEAVIVGVVGATLGLLAGLGLGAAGSAALSSLLDLRLPGSGLVVGAWTVVLAYLVGVLVTVLAAFIPAVRASAVPPLAAMRDVVRPDKPLTAVSIVGACFLVPGAVLAGLTATGQPFWMLALGVPLVFVGAALLSPLLARPVAGLVGRALSWGTSGKLGVRNTLRNPRRTAVTAIALMIGVALVSGVSVVGASFKATIQDLVASSFGPEIIVQTNLQAPPDGTSGFDPRRLAQVRALPGVTRAEPLHVTAATVQGTPNQFVAAGNLPAIQDMFALETAAGQLRALGPGELAVDANTAEGLGWKVGDQGRIKLPKGDARSYTVVGLYQTTPLVQGVILGPEAVGSFAGPLATQGYVELADGADTEAVRAEVERLMADYPLVTVGDRGDMIDQANAFIDIALGIVSVLLAVAILIAFLGILNTLLLSVFERIRELGLLRAIGLGRGGVVRMMGVESVLIAVFGCLLGIALGVALGAVATAALIERDLVSTITLPWLNLAALVVAAVVAGLVAALWPAIRAARLNVLEAIAYE